MTGGKFANGAITAAFSSLFNDGQHDVKNAVGDVLICIGGVELVASGAMLADDGSGIIIDDGAAINIGLWGLGNISIGCALKSDFSALKDAVENTLTKAKVSTFQLNERLPKVWVTYTLTNDAGQVYVGRTSGISSAINAVAARYSNHHKKGEGFGPPQIDKIAVGYVKGPAYQAIRGREQQLIDYYGGVGHPNVANRIRGVSRTNRNGHTFWERSNQYFGNIAPFTGIRY